MNDKRHHYRTSCRISACLEQRGLFSSKKNFQTSDIGMKGIFIKDIPELPVGSKKVISIHDNAGAPLRLNAHVAHVSDDGVGFTFFQPQIEDCLRLKHLVKPFWNRVDFLEGLILIMRYSHPSKELKDILKLTRLLETDSSGLFARAPHSASKCHFIH
jgi:hypothetical protein